MAAPTQPTRRRSRRAAEVTPTARWAISEVNVHARRRRLLSKERVHAGIDHPGGVVPLKILSSKS